MDSYLWCDIILTLSFDVFQHLTLICFVFVEENAGIALLLGASMCFMNLGYPSLSLITAPARTNPTTKERKADLILIRAYLCVYVCCFSSACVLYLYCTRWDGTKLWNDIKIRYVNASFCGFLYLSFPFLRNSVI